MNSIPEAICWHEGMQLLPQHFQQQSLRAEGVAALHAGAAHPWFWGVHQLELDESALSQGVVRVLSLIAVLPDGLPVHLEPGGGTPLQLNLAEVMASAQRQDLMVYLAVAPLWRGGRLDPHSGRYVSEAGEAVPDLASGESPEPLVRWRPDLRLATDESRADSVCIPLVRMGQQGGGFARLPYVPPSPRLTPESPLGRKIAALCARVREKSAFLSGRVKLARQTGHTEDVVEISRQLRSLWSRLPEVEAALFSRIAHPAQVYLLLAGMAGSLATLDPARGMPAFAPLVYENLLGGFDAMINWLLSTLETVRMGYRTVAFAHDAQGFWIVLPEALGAEDKLVIGLRMPGGTSESAAAQWLQRTIIASEAHIETLSLRRMRGMTWQPLDRGSQVSYSVGDDTRLFVLSTQSEWFDAVQHLRINASSAGGYVAPWEMVLFVPEQDAEGAPDHG
ncbi:type VI secretion system protein ImpJ [Silvimonas terrae]|uniref:Type VI secretion system protein ImpJ n=1 Tax=Silvimonas terrae TaxID=300266 RepID=A0A840RB59_9NEIS|nr:type VI secretion system baseplate subunit TssK [Silvimonas terrae]MBB5190659.1 type VI secretion system protein ImpJ [Silvimonas terrae]